MDTCSGVLALVVDPESRQWAMKNGLDILASGGQDVKYVESMVAEFGKEITVRIEKLGLYRVKFPILNVENISQKGSFLIQPYSCLFPTTYPTNRRT
jgi:hypothetical protein